jgi:hypothetical protein
MRVLQTLALPLGYRALKNGRGGMKAKYKEEFALSLLIE